MKKLILLFLATLCLCFSANSQSISDAIRKFDTALLNAQISKGETVISSINYADTNSCGSIVGWIQSEIKFAASQPQIPRLQIVRSSTLLPEEQTAVIATSRALPLQRPKKSENKKFVITGKYQELKDSVELFLYLDSSDGETFSSAKVLIPMKEIAERKLTLYPQNVEQAKTLYKDIESAKSVAKRNPKNSIPITAALLDSENNLADYVYPDSRVHFLIGSPGKDAYIAILNISAEGKKFWLKFDRRGSTSKFIPAGETWKSPDFRPVDNVQGSETIYIYAASSPKGLPIADSESHYLPETITTITRELMLDLSDGEVATGTFALSYTVLPSPAE